MTFVEHQPPSSLEMDMVHFVNDYIVEILDCKIDIINDCPEYDLDFYFPSGYPEKSLEKRKDIIVALRDTIESSFLYDELSPLYSYVLYHIIEEWSKINEEIPELIRHSLPEDLKKKILENLNILPDKVSDEYSEELFIIEMLENTQYYNSHCFHDTDFLEEDIRGLVECAINGMIDIVGLTFDELDQYIDVMPIDVAERYQKFRNNQQQKTEEINEYEIVRVIQNAMKTMAKRVVHHQGKSEAVLTADLQDIIEDTLARNYGVFIAREFTLGRAAKNIGETDLYFYMKNRGNNVDVAVLENKNIENFTDQYFQLMGYLNPNFKFGITVSINRKYTIAESEEKIVEALKNISDEFKVTNICKPESGEHYIVSEHIVPETMEKMRVYHFILNLNDESRVKAAQRARKKENKK